MTIREYLDPTHPNNVRNPARPMTTEELGVVALLGGLEQYARHCAPKYADPCACVEMGIFDMHDSARRMLSYAPETLDRGRIADRLAELLRDAWHIDPDTGEWIGEYDDRRERWITPPAAEVPTTA